MSTLRNSICRKTSNIRVRRFMKISSAACTNCSILRWFEDNLSTVHVWTSFSQWRRIIKNNLLVRWNDWNMLHRAGFLLIQEVCRWIVNKSFWKNSKNHLLVAQLAQSSFQALLFADTSVIDWRNSTASQLYNVNESKLYGNNLICVFNRLACWSC
jgi:hypothetical protein